MVRNFRRQVQRRENQTPPGFTGFHPPALLGGLWQKTRGWFDAGPHATGQITAAGRELQNEVTRLCVFVLSKYTGLDHETLSQSDGLQGWIRQQTLPITSDAVPQWVQDSESPDDTTTTTPKKRKRSRSAPIIVPAPTAPLPSPDAIPSGDAPFVTVTAIDVDTAEDDNLC